MTIKIRSISTKYITMVISHDNTEIDCGLYDVEESQELITTFQEAINDIERYIPFDKNKE